MFNKAIKSLFEVILRKKLGVRKPKPGEDIKWYESETILSGIVVIVAGIYELVAMVGRSNLGFDLPAIPDSIKASVATILGTTIVWGRWTAERNIK